MCTITVGQGWWWKELNYGCILSGRVSPPNTGDGVLLKMGVNILDINA